MGNAPTAIASAQKEAPQRVAVGAEGGAESGGGAGGDSLGDLEARLNNLRKD